MFVRNSELPVENLNQKRKITDIVLDIGSNIINLEMNNYYYKGLMERNNIYLNTIRSIGTSEDYLDIPKFIQINFDNFQLYDDRTMIKFVMVGEVKKIID